MKLAHFRLIIASFTAMLAVALFASADSLPTRASVDVAATPLETQILVKLNQERLAHGLKAVASNHLLDQAATDKAATLLAQGWFDHITKDGRTPWDFVHAAGYHYTLAGENLAMDFSDANSIHAAWLASPSHRENMLDPAYSDVGIATVSGTFDDHATIMVVELFGSVDQRSSLERSVDGILNTGSLIRNSQ